MNDELEKEVKQVLSEIEEEKNRATPYWIFEEDYWKQPREVCVVDEINCLEKDDSEILCSLNPKNEQWIRGLASVYGFTVERQGEFEDILGKFVKFIVRKEQKK